MTNNYYVDHRLAKQLELAEGQANAKFVESRMELQADSGACWIEVAGARIMFDGAGSPISQTFGFGMSGSPSDADFDEVEEFFFSRQTDVNHEVCPLAGPEILPQFRQRGYFPVEQSTVLFLPLNDWAPRENTDVPVRLCESSERDAWVESSVAGWSEFAEYADMMRDFATINFNRQDSLCFQVDFEDQPAATGSVMVCDNVGVLAGASTIPYFRRRGAQTALLASRLLAVRERGCDLAMMAAEPGSGSQRNAERNGFRIAYTRTKWAKPFVEPVRVVVSESLQ